MNDLFALGLVNALIWAGLFLYFLYLNGKVRKLEKR